MQDVDAILERLAVLIKQDKEYKTRLAAKARANYWLGVWLIVAVPFALIGLWAIASCVLVPLGVSL